MNAKTSVSLVLKRCVLNHLYLYIYNLAQEIPQCKHGDGKCLAEVITAILHKQFGGHKGLRLVPTDPLKINSLVLPRNPNSPVSLQLEFKDVYLTGISQAVIKEVR